MFISTYLCTPRLLEYMGQFQQIINSRSYFCHIIQGFSTKEKALNLQFYNNFVLEAHVPKSEAVSNFPPVHISKAIVLS